MEYICPQCHVYVELKDLGITEDLYNKHDLTLIHLQCSNEVRPINTVTDGKE